jgi:hypothetical protein
MLLGLFILATLRWQSNTKRIIAVAFGAGQTYAAGRRRNPKWKFPLKTHKLNI